MTHNYRRILIAATIILSCTMACLLGVEIYDGFVDRGGWKSENGQTYYTDFHGEPVFGWQEIDGNTYYFGLNRAMHTGWLHTENGSFFFDPDGRLHTGLLNTEDGNYFFDSTGHICTGWQETESGRNYFDPDGRMHTGWLEENGNTYYFQDDGQVWTGWLDLDGVRYYLDENGLLATGWLHTETDSFYLTDSGTVYTGWLEQGEYRYYFHEDGTMATGPVQIDGRTFYFTPKGIHVILVNRDHPVPEDYTLNLVEWAKYFEVDACCIDALNKMLADCNAAGYHYTMNSAYRSLQQQWGILYSRTQEYVDTGLPYHDAYATALRSVAFPGTSEHHLGLAVDIEGLEALKWLQEHCWEYGFILRYLDGKTHITGIIYEPWHFRYVGTEVSMDMKDTGLCLEEYLGAYVAETAGGEAGE